MHIIENRRSDNSSPKLKSGSLTSLGLYLSSEFICLLTVNYR